MSSIKLESNASGTGIFTIASPNSNTNRTLTLPDATGTVVVTGGAQTIEFAAGSASTPSITTTGDTNTGIFFPAADTIAFAEGGAETARITSGGNLQFNSGYGSVATAYGCRAWVNFDGTDTPSIRGNGNVSSITDNGTGDYTINFTTAMPDANYNSVSMGRHWNGTSDAGIFVCFQNQSTNGTTGRTTSSLRVSAQASTTALTDSPCVTVSIFR
jgi:hypothetical protein